MEDELVWMLDGVCGFPRSALPSSYLWSPYNQCSCHTLLDIIYSSTCQTPLCMLADTSVGWSAGYTYTLTYLTLTYLVVGLVDFTGRLISIHVWQCELFWGQNGITLYCYKWLSVIIQDLCIFHASVCVWVTVIVEFGHDIWITFWKYFKCQHENKS